MQTFYISISIDAPGWWNKEDIETRVQEIFPLLNTAVNQVKDNLREQAWWENCTFKLVPSFRVILK